MTGSTVPDYEQVISDIEEKERIAFTVSTEGWHRSTNTTPVPGTGNKTIDTIQQPGSEEQDHHPAQTKQDSAMTRAFKHK